MTKMFEDLAFVMAGLASRINDLILKGECDKDNPYLQKLDGMIQVLKIMGIDHEVSQVDFGDWEDKKILFVRIRVERFTVEV